MAKVKKCPKCKKPYVDYKQDDEAQYFIHAEKVGDTMRVETHFIPQKSATKKSRRENDAEPDWSHGCENCGQVPIVPATGLCGPCTFGEADTIDGNW